MRAMTFHEEASAEVNEAAEYYEERSRVPGLVYLRSRIRSVDLDIGETGCRSVGRLNPRLMVSDSVDPPVVVTVYHINKIVKYWRKS